MAPTLFDPEPLEESPRVDVKIEASWKEVLKDEFGKDYFGKIRESLRAEKAAGAVIYPKGSQIFNAFNQTPFEQVRVVILGQDPYHGPGQAHGLCFSVQDGVKPPPSLVNIFKEIESDTGIEMDKRNGNLEPWARQGVFLLNAILTVRHKSPASHRNLGWETFTDAVIRTLSERRENLVFMLWGSFARSKKVLIRADRHLILEAPHPSPYSASSGFFSCRHFSKANQYLKAHGKGAIDWKL